MTTEAEAIARDVVRLLHWPPDDSEESVLGTNLHQTTIANLRLGINEASHLYQQKGQHLPWQALSQTILLGCKRPDGSMYRVLPDVFVFPKTMSPNRPSASINVDGRPILVVEVLSESTVDTDLDMEMGKGYSYRTAAISEYLVLDPTGQWLGGGGRGWQLDGDKYADWGLDDKGRWQSREIPIAIGLEGSMVTVYTRDGRGMLREGEVEVTMRRQAEEMGRQAEELSRQAAEIEDLRRRLGER